MATSGRDRPAAPPPAAKPTIISQVATQRQDKDDNPLVAVRTVLYIDVGDLTPVEAREAFATVNELYANNKHPFFVVPVRSGRLRTDVIFEHEVLEMVQKLCEIKDGVIQLRDGCQQIDIMRTSI